MTSLQTKTYKFNKKNIKVSKDQNACDLSKYLKFALFTIIYLYKTTVKYHAITPQVCSRAK